MVLPFGIRSAPFLFYEFSSALEWISRTKLNISKVIHILDDFFFATPPPPPPQSKCMTALCQILLLFRDLNIPIAPGKLFPACTSLEFIGILLVSKKMEDRFPVDKLTRIQEALVQWTNRKSATLQELQSLIGTLQFACKVIAPGRPSCSALSTLQRVSSSPIGTSALIQVSARILLCGNIFSKIGMGCPSF